MTFGGEVHVSLSSQNYRVFKTISRQGNICKEFLSLFARLEAVQNRFAINWESGLQGEGNEEKGGKDLTNIYPVLL